MACALATASPAQGKGAVRATLEHPERLAGAGAGERLTIAWTLRSAPRLGVLDAAGEPFGADGVYLRVIGAERGARQIVWARPSARLRGHLSGRYLATMTVPGGGIASIAIGLAGYRYVADHAPTRADLNVPIVNDPFPRGSAGPAVGEGADAPWLPIAILLAAATTVVAVRHARRRRTGTTTIRSAHSQGLPPGSLLAAEDMAAGAPREPKPRDGSSPRATSWARRRWAP